MLFVLSGPSGSGKSTIAHAILAAFPELVFSVSATTRSMRAREREGVDYFFLSEAEFRERIAREEFVEWEEIYGNLYGTLKSEVDRHLARGAHLLFDIDVKGALSIKRHYPAAAVLIFIQPPEPAALRERLVLRGSDTPEIVEQRMTRAEMELGLADRFDHVVVNDNLDRSIPAAERIIAECTRRVADPARHSN